MRLGIVALVLCSLVAFLAVGAAANVADFQRGPAVMKPSPWPHQPGHTWNVGDGTVTWTAPLTRPGATKQPTATFRWTLPASVPAAGAKGRLTITATAGDQDVFAPAFSIDSVLVRCTGIPNTPSYGTGCSDGARAAVGVALQPNETKTVSQEFLIRSAPGDATIVTGAPQNVAYSYSGSSGSGGGSSGRPVSRVGSVSGDVIVTHADGSEEPLMANTTLRRGDEVSTGVDSTVVLTFSDGSTMEITEMTQVAVADLEQSGSRQAVAVQIKMGELAAKVNPKKTVQTDFKVDLPTGTTSSRGTKFRVFYDPGSKAAIVSVTQHSVAVDPRKRGLRTVIVPAGKEVELRAASMSRLAPIGKANARGGIDRAKAYRLVIAIVGRAAKSCGLTVPTGPPARLLTIKPRAAGWVVMLAVTGKVSGVSAWSVTHKKASPANALAQQIAGGC